MYGLAAGAAGVGALALAQLAEAKIVYTPAKVKVARGHYFALDLNHDGIVDFYLIRGGLSPFSENLSACQYRQTFISGTGCASTQGMNAIRTIDSKGERWGAALKYGEKIQPGKQFANRASLGRVNSDGAGTLSYLGPWLNGGKGVKNRYLGLKFKIEGRFHFGWARITIRTEEGFDYIAILTGYAYETIPGKSIVAGATNTGTPEPAMLGVLALGASGLSIWRREEPAITASRPNKS